MRAVLVTGSARGLAAAVAERLRRDGDAVVGADLLGGDVELDVHNAAGWAEAASALGLVNCAARTVVRDLFAIEPDEWDDVLAVNLRPVPRIRSIRPPLRSREGGRIVNVASDSAFKGHGSACTTQPRRPRCSPSTRRAAAALAVDGGSSL